MIHARRVLPAPLDTFVASLWYWETDEAPGYAKDAIMASRAPSLLISLGEDELRWYGGEGYQDRNRLRGVALCGTQARHFAIDAHQPKMMGVEFKPGGAFPFFGPAAHEFHDSHTSLEDVWGRDAERLHQRLVQAPTVEDRFDILAAVLVAKAARAFEHNPAVSFALARFERAPCSASIAATAREAEVDAKRFIRLFADEVGVTPKLYLRVARFQRVLNRIVRAPHVDWGDIVAQHGYYDQSHFIRDFRQFSGLNPTEYLKRRGPYTQHVPLPAA